MLGGFYQQYRSLAACILGFNIVAKRERAETRRALYGILAEEPDADEDADTTA